MARLILSEITYSKMMADIDSGFSDYSHEVIRSFIWMTHREQERVTNDIKRYKDDRCYPDYVRNAGAWYHGLTMRVNQLKRVRSKAKIIRAAYEKV